jgi:phenylpropionate dioxygenase-like ring-hydroxylating dioxygenase large terminal subunit
METCVEDDEIGERMDAGRRALMMRGDNEVGPYQSPMEDGMQHFHEWYRSHALLASPASSAEHGQRPGPAASAGLDTTATTHNAKD